jgi:N-acyl-D-aspartate/D-glutamate deacylase
VLGHPGFVDLHTHYDAELEVSPSLDESVRHGITTALIGSCGLSMAVGDPVDMADMFCRVEGIPRELVLPVLERAVTWRLAAEYLDHLAEKPLGPNVTADARALDDPRPRDGPRTVADEGVDADARRAADDGSAAARRRSRPGYLGLSINTLPWDKMDGDRFRSRPTPSVFAKWDEYRFLNRVLRRYGAVWQGVPDVSTKINVLMFLWESMPVGRRPPLRTMIISLADLKADRTIRHTAGRWRGCSTRSSAADLRFQSLPTPFDMFVDGLEVPVIEEFGAGTSALHEIDYEARRPAAAAGVPCPVPQAVACVLPRSRLPPRPRRVAHPRLPRRDGGRPHLRRGGPRARSGPDRLLPRPAGRARHQAALVHGHRQRPVEALRWVVDHPAVLIGFSDAGAHLRNMAFYNFGLRMLKLVRDAELAGQPFMTTGRAVHRLTAEIADYLGIDAGTLAPVVPRTSSSRPDAARRPARGHPRGADDGLPGPAALRPTQRGGRAHRAGQRPRGLARRRAGGGARRAAMGQLRRPVDRVLGPR